MNEEQDVCDSFIKLIGYAASALELTCHRIGDKFSDRPQCLITYTDIGISEDVLEIRFDAEEASVICRFDEAEVCNYCYLFPDSLREDNAHEYSFFLNNAYAYDFLSKHWVLENCSVSLEVVDSEIAFVFSPLP